MKWTIGRLLQWSSDNLAEKGIETPRLDSEVLLARVLNTERINLNLYPQKPISSPEFERYKKLSKRRSLREPLHHIIGYKEFWSLRFKVNRHVLIPRPETEILVQKSLEILKKYYSDYADLVYVNDIGTGCGNIPISLSKEQKNLHIVATDCSEEALSVAKENARLNNVENQICFQKADLFGELKIGSENNKFDLIVSNPPYIPTDEIETLAPEIKDYEPHTALDGGSDGLDVYRKIIPQIPNYLNKGCFVIFEIGYDQGKAIWELFSNHGCFSEIEITKDYSGHDRVISAKSA